MSYAAVTAHNAPPESLQPKPDPALLDAKDTNEHIGEMGSYDAPPSTSTSDLKYSSEKKGSQFKSDAEKKGSQVKSEAEKKGSQFKSDAEKKLKELEKDGKDLAQRGKAKGEQYEKKGRKEWEEHPEVYTSLLSAVNLAILGGVGYAAYINWGQPKWDRRIVSATTVGLIALFGAQGYFGTVEYNKSKKDY